MALEFPKDKQKEIEWLLSRYPRKEAAMLPLLHLAQYEFGYISDEVMDLVGKTLELPTSRVKDVVTFYTMYHEQPVGKYHFQVCHTLSCAIRGSSQVVSYLEQKCNVKCGKGVSADGKFSIEKVECLGSCNSAPMLQLNDDYHEFLSKESVDNLFEKLK